MCPPLMSDDAKGVAESDAIESLDGGALETPWDPDVPPQVQQHRGEELREGSQLAGKFRLLSRLGSGGMGAVWKARNEALDVDVAVKLIRADLQDSRLLDRLLAEARAAARLEHPNIVRVFDVGFTEAASPFIVMELLRGNDLAQAVRTRGAMPTVRAVRTLLPIAHALSVAHEANIVHRDLKPENIFLARYHENAIRPILLDFGIAKFSSPETRRLTVDRSPLGSPEYMSPEQARGDDVDAQTDVWSFSVVLYEAVTGHLPFAHENYNRLLRSIIEEPPPPFDQFGIQDPILWSIVERGLKKDPLQRWRGMRTFGIELARWLLARGIEEDIGHTSVRGTWIPVVRSSHSLAPPARLESPRRSDPVILDDDDDPESQPVVPMAPGPRRSGRVLFWGIVALVVAATGILWATRWSHPEVSATPPQATGMAPEKANLVDAETAPSRGAGLAPRPTATTASATIEEPLAAAPTASAAVSPPNSAAVSSEAARGSRPRRSSVASQAKPSQAQSLDIKTDF